MKEIMIKQYYIQVLYELRIQGEKEMTIEMNLYAYIAMCIGVCALIVASIISIIRN